MKGSAILRVILLVGFAIATLWFGVMGAWLLFHRRGLPALGAIVVWFACWSIFLVVADVHRNRRRLDRMHADEEAARPRPISTRLETGGGHS